MGLSQFIATSDGEIIPNPRFRNRVAVLHRKVRETRRDHAHKIALRLIRENQAVYAEDLAVCGLARTRLAKSVHDAGWSQRLRLMDVKPLSVNEPLAVLPRALSCTRLAVRATSVP